MLFNRPSWFAVHKLSKEERKSIKERQRLAKYIVNNFCLGSSGRWEVPHTMLNDTTALSQFVTDMQETVNNYWGDDANRRKWIISLEVKVDDFFEKTTWVRLDVERDMISFDDGEVTDSTEANGWDMSEVYCM